MNIPPRASGPDETPTAERRELILSEEQLAVSTVRVPTRRVRLEKYVVTETRTITVQVSHEEVRLVEVDLGEGGADSYTDAQAVDQDRWMTVSEERIAITTEVVPVERVRLAVTSVTEDRTVTDDIRREQVALETDTDFRSASNDHTHPTVTEEHA